MIARLVGLYCIVDKGAARSAEAELGAVQVRGGCPCATSFLTLHVAGSNFPLGIQSAAMPVGAVGGAQEVTVKTALGQRTDELERPNSREKRRNRQAVRVRVQIEVLRRDLQ